MFLFDGLKATGIDITSLDENKSERFLSLFFQKVTARTSSSEEELFDFPTTTSTYT